MLGGKPIAATRKKRAKMMRRKGVSQFVGFLKQEEEDEGTWEEVCGGEGSSVALDGAVDAGDKRAGSEVPD